MPLITSAVEQALAIKAICETNINLWALEAVYYGDQTKIPKSPIICVESGAKRSSLKGAPRTTRVLLTTYVLIYHALVTRAEDIRQANDEFVSQVEAALNLSPSLTGKLIHGFCTNVEPGYAMRSGSLMRVTRITYEGESQAQLPSN